METNDAQPAARPLPILARWLDPSVAVAFACIVVLLLLGSLYSPSFLSPEYLLQQLQVGSFLALVSTGMMIVILLGQIDLSVPWIITVGGMMSTAAAGWGPWGATFAIPVGILCGLAFGLINGIGVAYLRVPSMIFTLAINSVALGLMTVRTGGFAPQDMATDAMNELATGRLIFGIPNPVWVWIVVGGATVFLLRRTVFGRAVYAIGNRERAAYLSGINTNRTILTAFVLCGMASGLAGVLLAGYSTKAYQGMGDAYLLPAIAAVVIGGTNILGGRGRYLGTFIGVILIVLLNSVLSIMQMPEAGRQIIYGCVIIAMLLVHGRGDKASA
jgi:ribose transport system permease protein